MNLGSAVNSFQDPRRSKTVDGIKPLRVLFVSHGTGLGGGERVMVELIEGLDRRFIIPEAVVAEEGPLTSTLRAMDVPVSVCAAPWWLPFSTEPERGYLFRRYWEQAPRFVAPVASIIRRFGADVVYSNSSPIIHAALAAHQTRRPHVQHMQDLLGWPHLGLHMPFGRAQAAYRIIGWLSSIVVCPGRTIRDDIGRAIPAAKCRIVPYGFRSSPPSPSPLVLPGPEYPVIRIGIVGSVDRRKGADVIAQVVRRVCLEVPRAHFYWAGSGDQGLMTALTNDATLDARTHLHFLGYTNRIPDFMRSIDILLHPARNDTFPRVLIEAGIAARAVVATRSGGAQDIITHGTTGLLTPVDDVEALARAVLRLIREPEVRQRMGAAAQTRASTFGMAEFQAGMQRALVEAHLMGPAIRGTVVSRGIDRVIDLPSRMVPGLRRWFGRHHHQNACL
jgi:glycosyltransferase involved in cell wall biosynthesis